MSNGKRGRDLSDEIRWGLELADHLRVSSGRDDYLEDGWEEDEGAVPTVDAQRAELANGPRAGKGR